MTASVLLTFALFLTSALVHLTAARLCDGYCRTLAWRWPLPMLVLLAALFVLHVISALIFAGGFVIGETWGLGGFAKETAIGWMDVFYFSLINITTLGLGDIYPTGHLRFMAGIESLTGFLLISISASFAFRLINDMRQGEKQ